MDLDARSLQPDLKAVLLAKVREYKADLNNIKREVKKIISADLNPSSARDELLESTMTNAMMKVRFIFNLTSVADVKGQFIVL